MEKNNLTQARTCVYNVNYHIVWSVKYRKKILNAPIELYLKNLFQEIAEIKKKLWKGVLWNNSFYLETVGSISEESIKKYIKKQKKGDNLSD